MADLREDQAFGFAPIFFEGGDHAAGLVHGHAAVFFAMDDKCGRGDGFSKVEGREASGLAGEIPYRDTWGGKKGWLLAASL